MKFSIKAVAKIAAVAGPLLLGAAGTVMGGWTSIDNRLTANESDIKTLRAFREADKETDAQRDKRIDQGMADIRDTVHEILHRMDRAEGRDH